MSFELRYATSFLEFNACFTVFLVVVLSSRIYLDTDIQTFKPFKPTALPSFCGFNDIHHTRLQSHYGLLSRVKRQTELRRQPKSSHQSTNKAHSCQMQNVGSANSTGNHIKCGRGHTSGSQISSPSASAQIPPQIGANKPLKRPPDDKLLKREKTIEIAVFIDQALDNKFGGLSGGFVEMNRQVLTIMNQVQHLFRYSSLSIPMTLKLKLVERMKDYERNFGEPAPNPARGDIDAYLTNFCLWQQARLNKERGHLTWDHAILLSGLDLYKISADKRQNLTAVLGLAWIGGMCKTNYSCAVNEGTNFEAAFVIAHELGHSLGVQHDGQKNSCDPSKYIMSDKTGPGKVHWSRCSNEYLRDAVKRHQLECLDVEATGEPVDSLNDLSKILPPGEVYSISEQCKLAFGNQFLPFVTQQHPFNNTCKELWCFNKSLAKAAHPALEGSLCEAGKVCREGKCEQLDKLST